MVGQGYNDPTDPQDGGSADTVTSSSVGSIVGNKKYEAVFCRISTSGQAKTFFDASCSVLHEMPHHITADDKDLEVLTLISAQKTGLQEVSKA